MDVHGYAVEKGKQIKNIQMSIKNSEFMSICCYEKISMAEY